MKHEADSSIDKVSVKYLLEKQKREPVKMSKNSFLTHRAKERKIITYGEFE